MEHLPWLLLIIPFVSAAIIQLGLKRSATASSLLSTLAVGITFALSLTILGKDLSATFTWIETGSFSVNIGYQLDKLASGMMIVVTGIGVLVHVFSLGYMKTDESKARYFGCLSMFMFSMTGIVLASNFVMMFIFWELVGLSSYLLIGHWYHKESAAEAAKKAFLTNRIGDFGFMIGILMLWGVTGTVIFSEMGSSPFKNVTTHVSGLAVLLIFCGAIGKSAQAPLHVWLPDAMEGPTPVSALIHAATMVAAGVYMMARLYVSVGTNMIPDWSSDVIAWIGGITSLLAALMATQQNDIKKILAYSTLSQLGYMIMAVGLLAPEVGMFHLFTHAWFKALLFLGSGAVIYACHHEQDIWKMGGLMSKMPITSITFLVGTLALTAVPFTAGFYSKEEVLYAALDKPILFALAAIVAMLTTFYMFRLFFVAFLGSPRGHGSEEAKEVSPIMFVPLVILACMAFIAPHISSILPIPSEWVLHHFKFFPDLTSSVFWTSIGVFTLGLALAYFFYMGKDEEPLNISLFRNKFYIDERYQWLIKIFQDAFAAIIRFLDDFFIGTMVVGGATRSAQGVGNLFRRFAQNGNLSNYAYLMGLGAVLVIYFTVFAN